MEVVGAGLESGGRVLDRFRGQERRGSRVARGVNGGAAAGGIAAQHRARVSVTGSNGDSIRDT